MNSYTLDEIYIGQKESVTKTITKGDIYVFAGLSDDYCPLHVNKEYGEKSRFGTNIAHGYIAGTLFSTLMGCFLPGVGALYVRQSMNFVKPVYVGDTITATFEVVQIGENVVKADGTEKFAANHVILKATAVNQNGEVVVEGEACGLPPIEKVDCSCY